MAITNLDQLLAALTSNNGTTVQVIRAWKNGTNPGVGIWADLGRFAGIPATMPTPTTGVGAIPVANTTGFPVFQNPSGANVSYLANLQLTAGGQLSLLLVDRLWHNSGIATNVTTLTTFNGLTVNRPDGLGSDTELWAQQWGTQGANQATVTVNYTNQNGNPASTSLVINNTSATTNQQVPLAAGDSGVRSVQSCQLSNSTGSLANLGFTIVRRLAEITTLGTGLSVDHPAGGKILDVFGCGMVQIPGNAALSAFISAGASTTGDIRLALTVIQG